MRRRDFLKVAAAGAAVPALAGCRSDEPAPPRWTPEAMIRPASSRVAVLSAASYDASLEDVVRRGLEACDVSVQGLRVLLKPNLVEYDPNGVINTHPWLIAATIEALRSMGAREVIVGEGSGHRRDNEYLLAASGLSAALKDTGARFVDLNHDVVGRVPLRSSYTRLPELWLPRTLLDADLFISMPKLKTHHWAGVTLSMKNLFGIVPGAIYGWPKNILHWNGIQPSILDINTALEVPRFNIVDGIVGMEGDGPIRGEARPSGVVVFGADPVAVDATSARLMTIEPERIAYLSEAGKFLGNVHEERIEQIGESISSYRQDYRVLESYAHLKA